MDKLARVPEAIAKVLDNGETVRQFARTMQDATSVIYLGRHVGFPVALEGALKLKEICYIHAEGFAAGELKHGPDVYKRQTESLTRPSGPWDRGTPRRCACS